jgi:hypothetical protein
VTGKLTDRGAVMLVLFKKPLETVLVDIFSPEPEGFIALA